MTAPNIEEIAASLRNFSLGGRRETSPEQHQLAAAAAVVARRRPIQVNASDYAGITLDLNSEVPLPDNWEQCLDLRTGDLYYINRADGTRTAADPRLGITCHRESYCSSEESFDDDDDGGGDEDDGEEGDDDCSDAEGSSSSVGNGVDDDDFYGVYRPRIPPVDFPSSSNAGGAGHNVLVAAGCKSCFMYFMVPKRGQCCPKCGGFLFHLGRNGYF
ncbi:hypothetical protein HPP92_011257 [Vanilla planifolia]|uniref:WW domain-containing protein n=1 Tax=Vanilla planifolia TaxID=51239 RepID=A0A835V3C0_VANPL|nr:hypothetical protein HPP92_011257 [Vanilla planifolia]